LVLIICNWVTGVCCCGGWEFDSQSSNPSGHTQAYSSLRIILQIPCPSRGNICWIEGVIRELWVPYKGLTDCCTLFCWYSHKLRMSIEKSWHTTIHSGVLDAFYMKHNRSELPILQVHIILKLRSTLLNNFPSFGKVKGTA